MKHFKQIIIYLSILSFLTVVIFSSNPLKVYAEVPSTQKVISHVGAWGEYPFNYTLQGKYFTIEDTTGIPSSTILNPQYFYTDDNETFYALEGKDLYIAILNRGIGVSVRNDFAATLYNNFMQRIQIYDNSAHLYLQGALYDSNDLFLGYCVNDITGCYYNQPAPADTPAVNVPDDLTDDVYNHYKYYTNDIYPDYITVYPSSKEYTLEHYGTATQIGGVNETQLQFQKDLVNSALTSNDNIYELVYTAKKVDDTNWYFKVNPLYTLNDLHYIYHSPNNTYTQWNSLCEYFDLKKDGDTSLLYTDIISSPDKTNTNTYINVRPYDSAGNTPVTVPKYSLADAEQSTWNFDGFTVGWYHSSSYYQFRGLGGQPYTIYKNADVYNDVKNKTYTPTGIPSSIYVNYNPNNDNSFTISYNNVDNSQTNNSIIFTDSHDELIDNTNNSVINTTEIINNTTEIIYIYYPGGNPGPTPPDPDNPDDPNIEDDTVLDAILAALKRFFDVIGKILGTVLAGLLEVIDALLESIAGIMDNLTGLTEFLAALFSWIPSPLPQVIALGFSICVLAAIIKFIRG